MLRGEIWGLQKTGCEQAGLTDPIGQENHPWGSVAGVSVLQIKQRRKKTQCEWKKCGWFPVPCLLQWDSSNSDISAKKTEKIWNAGAESSPILAATPPYVLGLQDNSETQGTPS